MTIKLNRIPKILLTATALTFGTAGVVLAHPGHEASPLDSAKPAALVVANGNTPAKAKRQQQRRDAKTAKRQAKIAKRQEHKAQRKQAQGMQRLAKFDANGNGKIEKTERHAVRAQRFVALDANGDGSLSLGEMQTAKAKARAAKQSKRAAKEAKRNAKLATLSPEQRAKRMAKIAKRQARSKAREAKGNGSKMAKRFAMMDADKSGSLSQSEFAQGPGKAKGRDKRARKNNARKS